MEIKYFVDKCNTYFGLILRILNSRPFKSPGGTLSKVFDLVKTTAFPVVMNSISNPDAGLDYNFCPPATVAGRFHNLVATQNIIFFWLVNEANAAAIYMLYWRLAGCWC